MYTKWNEIPRHIRMRAINEYLDLKAAISDTASEGLRKMMEIANEIASR